ncbi:NAD(P)/FAD-dependent oxidoreductase [Roseomonas sp. OT10]|uniref:NAD(P)/FAD-dependent oxidoreductase n=1 Tax=Roseomonas cutis TaxID=2897332 RepID=UPI001E58F25C|nr:NAD(P)/FAD-dependent oxidoreductase [Roseomonas sp. OT10]UFN49795.1 NAD(P)/FAD-dependent oxidoreductase [Roseomonas sp. OT10]
MSDREQGGAAAVAATPRAPETRPDPGLHRIVIVGGGAGGLELATRLGDTLGRRGEAEISLVDRGRRHLWKPLLHEVAAGSMNVDEHELDYLAQAHWHHFRFRYGEMIGLDRAAKQVLLAPTLDEEGREITPRRTIPYDTLVIAVGSVVNDFGTPGVAEHAIALDTLAQAERFNRRLVNACLRAHTQHGPVRPEQLHVAIIGAGATGSELAAELHRTTRTVIAYGLDRVDPERDIQITLIEAAERILPGLPPRISAAATGVLTRLGVEIRVNAKVSEVRADGVQLADGGFIPSELVVWAAGVKGPAVLAELDGLEVTKTNQLVVGPTLQTTRDADVFAFGDCAAAPRPGHDRPVPPRAQAAHQQAEHLFRQLRRRLRGEAPEPYTYRDFGSLVSLGEERTVGNLMGFLSGKSMMIEGFVARIMYQSLYKMHERALHGWPKVALTTLARLITRRTEPHVKLH